MLINFFRKNDLAVLLLIYVIVLVKSLYTSRLGFGLLDEGEYLHIGLRILRGEIPYGDFFSYLPILYDYWNALAFKIFGVSVFGPRLLNSIIFSFVPVLFYLIARRFSSTLVALLISISFGFVETSMERLYYHVFTFGTLLLYFDFLKGYRRYGLFAGLLLGVAALFRMDVAIQFFLGLSIVAVLFYKHHSRRWLDVSLHQLISFGLGFIIPIAFFIGWLLKHNLLERYIQISIVTPTEFAAAQDFPFPKPWDLLPQSLSPRDIFYSYEAFFAYLIISIYLYALYYLISNWKKIWKNTPELPTFLLIAVFTTPYMFSRPDLGHMVKGGIPAFFIAAFLLEKLRSRFRCLIVIPVILICVGIAQIFWWSMFLDTTIQTPNGTIKTNSKAIGNTGMVSAETIKKSLDFIAENSLPGEQILAVPYMSGLYFLADRPSSLYVGNIYYGYIPNEEKYVEELKMVNPKVVIYDYSYRPRGYSKSLHQFYPNIDKYIIDNFKIVDKSPEGWLFMVRK